MIHQIKKPRADTRGSLQTAPLQRRGPLATFGTSGRIQAGSIVTRAAASSTRVKFKRSMALAASCRISK